MHGDRQKITREEGEMKKYLAAVRASATVGGNETKGGRRKTNQK